MRNVAPILVGAIAFVFFISCSSNSDGTGYHPWPFNSNSKKSNSNPQLAINDPAYGNPANNSHLTRDQAAHLLQRVQFEYGDTYQLPLARREHQGEDAVLGQSQRQIDQKIFAELLEQEGVVCCETQGERSGSSTLYRYSLTPEWQRYSPQVNELYGEPSAWFALGTPYRLSQVTGIRQEGTQAIVEATFIAGPSAQGERLSAIMQRIRQAKGCSHNDEWWCIPVRVPPPSSTRRNFIFAKYDDGWRLAE